MTEPKLTYSLDEVTRLTGLSRRELHRQIAAGFLRSIVVGRRRLVHANALDAFLCEHEDGGPQAKAA